MTIYDIKNDMEFRVLAQLGYGLLKIALSSGNKCNSRKNIKECIGIYDDFVFNITSKRLNEFEPMNHFLQKCDKLVDKYRLLI